MNESINKGKWPEAVTSEDNRLTPAQTEIFRLMGYGWGGKTIAGKLGVSHKTINSHQEHMKARLKVASTEQLRALAIRWQWDPQFDPAKLETYLALELQ